MLSKRYIVPVSGHNFKMPYYCSCCLKATNEKYSVFNSKNAGAVKKTYRVDIPLCEECKNHAFSKTYRDELLLALLLSAIVEAGILMALGLLIEISNAVIYGILAGISVFLIFLFVRKIPALNSPHTSRNNFVEIISFEHTFKLERMGIITKDENGMAFIFSNKEFAKIFKEINGEKAGEIVSIKGDNELEKTDLFSAIEGVHYWIILSILLSACIAVAFVLIVDNFF